MTKMVAATCSNCGKQYSAHAWRMKPDNTRYRSKYCSRDCSKGHCTSAPANERFWEKVDKTDTCWNWTGAKNTWGYGSFWVDRRAVVATRFIWEETHGKIPDGLWVLHSCDNPACVRLDHLFLGTLKDNSKDCLNKNRRPHLLKIEQVKEIRQRLQEMGATQATYENLAPEYGVSDQAIYHIATGRTWKWIS